MAEIAPETYESRWDLSSATPEAAMLAVDGSASEDVLARSGRWTARQVAAALDLKAGDRVLELGCGVGRIGRELAGHCAEWHGTDISRNMLESAAVRLEGIANAHLHKLERTSLEAFADESFDKVYCVAVFIHMDKEDQFLYLREIARVLAPGGVAYLEAWNLASPVGWKRWMMEVDHWARSDQTRRKDISRNQFNHPEEFRLYLEHAGLQPLRLYADTAWIQAIATRGADDARQEALGRTIDRREGDIRYSANWDRLFGQIIDILSGRQDIQLVLDELEERTDEESGVLRDHLKGLARVMGR